MTSIIYVTSDLANQDPNTIVCSTVYGTVLPPLTKQVWRNGNLMVAYDATIWELLSDSFGMSNYLEIQIRSNVCTLTVMVAIGNGTMLPDEIDGMYAYTDDKTGPIIVYGDFPDHMVTIKSDIMCMSMNLSGLNTTGHMWHHSLPDDIQLTVV